ncbi:Carboxypeptidase [Paragonimus heterotremus]|uniref:Carboxypeptidase n=1 Tax=Paragonimus heterotremus TaxID=100268 RepID=A0A8J4WK12_9TREM|nr:Carboxypeptidase [Paragonimus heterotremus]
MRLLLLVLLAIVVTGRTSQRDTKGDLSYEKITTENDRISFLPGLSDQPSFAQYSGYLTGSSDNFQLHYWFIEATEEPDEAPLVLWLNGGPGCSSMEGLLEENGPFIVQPGQTLIPNPYSWNNFANILYLETPAGVGFSFAKDGNVTTNDDLTSLNNYHALLSFFEKFPAYKNRDFFIFGESYAGVYVPTLAVRILENPTSGVNLKGIAVGNPLTSFKLNDNSLIYFLYYHGLVDESLWNDVLNNCCGSQCANKCMFTDNNSSLCQNTLKSILNVLSGLNIYNLYSDCAGGVPETFVRMTSSSMWGQKGLSKRPDVANLFRNSMFWKSLTKSHPSLSVDIPCIDDSRITTYLNQPAVREALHVNLGFLPEWEICSDEVYNTYDCVYEDLSEQYLYVLKKKIPVMLFAGDVDLACNYLGLLWFVDNLKMQVESEMEHWLFQDTDGTKQVGGVYKILKTAESAPLWYVTVRGSGHMVPENKPVAAYHMITQFVSGEDF